MVQEYTGLSMCDVEELNIIDYRVFLRDAVIYNCMKSDAGREFLERCWLLEQREPDREALRNKFSRA